MKLIVTEEMRFRQRVVKYAIKHDNNAKAARRYHTSRQQVQRWRNKYEGSVQSLSNKSTRPKSHPNQHTQDELNLIKYKYRYHGHEGLAEVYRKLPDDGYTRTYDSMCRQIKKLSLKKSQKAKSYPKSRFKPIRPQKPGEFVQIDVKFVPNECIGFNSNHTRYYQITAKDLFSRKRIIKLVNENSTYTISEFLKRLEIKMGFKISPVQTDNGREFCNDEGSAISRFEKVLEQMKIKHKRTRPYSPWQNGVVERSHRIDNDMFYSKRRFSSETEMYKSFERYSTRTNNISRKVLGFKTPKEKVAEYFKNAA